MYFVLCARYSKAEKLSDPAAYGEFTFLLTGDPKKHVQRFDVRRSRPLLSRPRARARLRASWSRSRT